MVSGSNPIAPGFLARHATFKLSLCDSRSFTCWAVRCSLLSPHEISIKLNNRSIVARIFKSEMFVASEGGCDGAGQSPSAHWLYPITTDEFVLPPLPPSQVLPPFEGFDGSFGFCGTGHESECRGGLLRGRPASRCRSLREGCGGKVRGMASLRNWKSGLAFVAGRRNHSGRWSTWPRASSGSIAERMSARSATQTPMAVN